MNWKVSLDKYLTTPHEDGFDNWCENVLGMDLSDEFYKQNEEWILEYDGTCNKWLNKLYDRGYETKQAAKMIERTFNKFIRKK